MYAACRSRVAFAVASVLTLRYCHFPRFSLVTCDARLRVFYILLMLRLRRTRAIENFIHPFFF